MRIVRFIRNGSTVWGVVEGDAVRVMSAGFKPTEHMLAWADISLLPPCVPSKIVCAGLNYHDHATELGMSVPEEPLVFLKPPSSLCPPGGDILYPKQTQNLHHEAELAVVLGAVTKNVPLEEVDSHILGYTCANDVTARDLQAIDGQWTRAKGFDTFLPLGPWIETEFDPADARIRLCVNGTIRQESSTGQLIFPVPFLVSFISQVMTLLPGDVVLTGTPSGIGPLNRGDVVEVDIAGIGILQNTVR